MSSPEHHHRKKRAGKACDSCRIKKTKCDGRKPCSRCIADNRICAYSDKRKSKEKAHPPGYVELLETRVELLTRSLEKMVHLSESHLPWLSSLMARARADHSRLSPGEHPDNDLKDDYVPINEVVHHLIAEHGILDNMPVEWDHNAMDLPPEVFSAEEDDCVTSLDHDNPHASGHRRMGRHSRSASDRSGRSTSSSRRGSRNTMNHTPSITEQLNMDGISLAGYSNTSMPPSLFRQDTSPLFARAEMLDRRPSGQFLASHMEMAASSSSSSLASLAARLENHDIGPNSPPGLLSASASASASGMTPTTSLSGQSESTLPSSAVSATPQPTYQPGSLRRHTSLNDHAFRSRPTDHIHKPKTHPHIPTRQDPTGASTGAAAASNPTATSFPNASLMLSPAHSFSVGFQSPEVDDFAAFPFSDDPTYPDIDDTWRGLSSFRPDSTAGTEGSSV
ncbi:hypothetical protein FT663_01780 [Candidozyma haemuli var. vulneris]|uniref:Zn(2)-C6 fungal-type domain-containing protein n=1 Tax=Candidozyma haemuli TaxID=45357 RepID=A0A2V1B0F9_9ASCO|nr:hypothetical protein CXQ85_002881 [[Candida] haemuloni]KAF3991097.1 hypothetical protein FT662_01925 [[Candida] haemuloni var. vulneris]KAF3993612.1 hypothetical protein FT663_01780 [[Candida] haemuloni var. vulneris]PVH23153.1 hypothetical protein CXQ85_002881 [[Candida] haemuloni]